MTITYRLVKGSPLTFAEEDGNFSDLNGRVSSLETARFANPIDTITVVGNQMTFHYTTAAGGGSDTVTLPTAQWNSRGNWQPSTVYAVNDLVIEASNLYLVKIAHTSPTSFDPGEQIGGQYVYQFIFGPLGQTETVTLTAISYTLQGTDNLKYYRCTTHHTAGIVIIIPDDADVAIPIDSEITFRQGADHLIFQADTGATLNVPVGHHASTDHIGAVVTVKKVGAGTWDIFGALTVGT
jgi:hypothetical protein